MTHLIRYNHGQLDHSVVAAFPEKASKRAQLHGSKTTASRNWGCPQFHAFRKLGYCGPAYPRAITSASRESQNVRTHGHTTYKEEAPCHLRTISSSWAAAITACSPPRTLPKQDSAYAAWKQTRNSAAAPAQARCARPDISPTCWFTESNIPDRFPIMPPTSISLSHSVSASSRKSIQCDLLSAPPDYYGRGKDFPGTV